MFSSSDPFDIMSCRSYLNPTGIQVSASRVTDDEYILRPEDSLALFPSFLSELRWQKDSQRIEYDLAHLQLWHKGIFIR